MGKSKIFKFLPLIIACSIACGIYIGHYYTRNAIDKDPRSTGAYNKLDLLLEVIETEYVDSISRKDLIERSIPHILTELDPHSKYISAKNLDAVNRELEGTFGGIGVTYIILEDTLTVTDVIKGGPSERAGIRQGDRIVMVNDTLRVGKGMTREKAVNLLRGKKDTDVKISVRRPGEEDLLHFNITRGDIIVSSVLVSYKVSSDIGYIKVTQFGGSTYQDFLLALAKLRNQGCNHYILDLRDNMGGYLDAAINMANEFLPADRLIVFTEGKAFPRAESVSNGLGSCQQSSLVILMDELSASASEVLAGAIQDNDRGLIVGRRSFGKGLVQRQPAFSDGSAVRLTVARYFTPSGRSIQKPYKPGKEQEYENDVWQRYLRGEFTSKDSIKLNDSLRYSTLGGRPVYGGGGIMPDIFVALDTTWSTSYSNAIMRAGLLDNFAFRYYEKHREELKEFRHYWPMYEYLNEQNILDELVVYAEEKGIKQRPYLIQLSGRMLEINTKALICRYALGDEAFYPVFFMLDGAYKRAVKEMKDKTDPLLKIGNE